MAAEFTGNIKTVPAPELAKSPFVIIDLDQSMVAQLMIF
jgi:hypothetical protein